MGGSRLLCAALALFAAWVSPVRAADRVVVGFAQDTLANDWRAAQVRHFIAALSGHPEIEVVVTNAGGSTAQQIMDVENLTAQGVKVLVTSPRDGDALAPAIAAAHAKGIPVVLLTRRAATESYTTFIGPDDHAIGRHAAEFLNTRLGGRGRILVLTGVPTASTAIARTTGFVAALTAYPGLDIVAMRPGNYLRADALNATEDAVLSGLAFDAIYAQSDSMASGARLALKGNGIAPASKPTIGIDYIREARDAIRAGEQEASFLYPTCAREGAEIVLKLLKGQKVPREIVVPSELVTRENVDDVAPIF
ncbi:MAG TPA: substrate-binding domain-containing protein [Candidatus Omnitrophota bacterium]|nr:substrate-binding domain-containing protein [Candidatus Omnitrophota bacterium]